MIELGPEQPTDGPAIERLLDRAFEPERKDRSSYTLRAGNGPVVSLGFTARENGKVIGTIRFWPITIGGTAHAILLGPIAVDPDHQGRALGGRLVRHGLDAARARGDAIVVAVGVQAYLGRFGFAPARPRGLIFDTSVADDRFLVLELRPGALQGISGPLAPGGRLRRGLALLNFNRPRAAA